MVRASTTRRNAGPNPLWPGSEARRTLEVRHPNQVEEMGMLGLVELECAAYRLQDVVGDAARLAALEPRVVLDADTGEERDLLSP
jgi:hypothetical protein